MLLAASCLHAKTHFAPPPVGETPALQATSQQHLARRLLCEWRRLAAEAKSERTDALRGAVTNQLLLRRRGWTAWRLAVAEKKQRHEAQAAAEQHRRATTLRHCWAAWQEWTVLCRGMRQRRAARLQAAVVYAWRGAARAAEKRRLADACAARAAHRRFCSSLAAWRGVVAAKRAQRHQVAHARALLARRMMSRWASVGRCPLRWWVEVKAIRSKSSVMATFGPDASPAPIPTSTIGHRVLSGWRRAALAGKLYHTLSTVQQLQVAVERAREELEHKSQQVGGWVGGWVAAAGGHSTASCKACGLAGCLLLIACCCSCTTPALCPKYRSFLDRATPPARPCAPAD